MSLSKKMFIGPDGKVTWTAVGMIYGLILVSIITVKWLIDGEVSVSYLEWSTVIIPILLAARPVQKGIGSFASRFINRESIGDEPVTTKEQKKADEVLGVGKERIGNFSMQEFESKDGSPMPPAVKKNILKLMEQLEVIRAACGNNPLLITSGYRSPAHNATVKGAAPNSRHVLGQAADFKVKGMRASEVQKIVERLMDAGQIIAGGIGIAKTYTHYDIRGTKTKWKY